MTGLDEVPPFLALPFDWYILEQWNSSDPFDESPQRRQRHIELGIEFAALGHEGRRPYAQKAFDFHWQTGNQHIPQNVAEVPQDLLNAPERNSCHPEYSRHTTWLRTAYGPDTDSRFKELVESNPDNVAIMSIYEDPQRYDFADENVHHISALYPSLLEATTQNYADEDEYPYDSDEVQEHLFLTKFKDTDAEEDPLGAAQKNFFVADQETMKTGMVRWVFANQFGVPLFDERIRAENLYQAVALEKKRSLREFREEVREGWFGMRDDDPRGVEEKFRVPIRRVGRR